ncbi:MAG: hypothetical protein WA700_06335 [Acidobacteriaceae bacterium]
MKAEVYRSGRRCVQHLGDGALLLAVRFVLAAIPYKVRVAQD